jgi:hypothetical protein
MALSIIYRSNGESSLRAYVACAVPRFAAPPVEVEARVVIADPRLTATAKRGPATSGPRNAEESVWPRPKTPGVQMPDARPLNKAQRFIIDPDLMVQWEEEARRKQA